VFKAAKRRRRRLGVVSLGAGPLAGAANQLADLYGDTATVCDLVDLHGLELSDAEIAAVMLELWNVAGSSEQASAAITGTGDSISELLVSRVNERASEQIPEKWTKRSAAKALWDARRCRSGGLGSREHGRVQRP